MHILVATRICVTTPHKFSTVCYWTQVSPQRQPGAILDVMMTAPIEVMMF